MVLRMRRSAGRYRLVALVLLAGGLAVAACGLPLIGGPLALPVAAVGLMAAALSVLPYRESLERRDRAEGLEVVAGEWRALEPDDRPSRARLLALMGMMFGRELEADDGAEALR